jgi:hypothetical protein
MFSAYSWGDFFKVVIAILIPYYAFVIWKYYRHDIRDWYNNRGQKDKPTPSLAPDGNEDEDDDKSVASNYYKVNSYSSTQSQPVASNQESQRPDPQPTNRQGSPVADLADAEVVNEDQPSGFELPILVEGYRPQEQSVDELIETAKGLVVDQEGVVTPKDPADKKAARLAAAVNKQQGNRVFGDMPFSR